VDSTGLTQSGQVEIGMGGLNIGVGSLDDRWFPDAGPVDTGAEQGEGRQQNCGRGYDAYNPPASDVGDQERSRENT
jgi:hypothetical protein